MRTLSEIVSMPLRGKSRCRRTSRNRCPRTSCAASRRGLRLLLDTNVLLWAMAGDARVDPLRERLLDEDNEVYVSAASCWEVAIKAGLGKLDVDVAELRKAVRPSGFLELPVLGAHTERLVGLPASHRDPFDRLLVAQARAEPMSLLTSDRLLAHGRRLGRGGLSWAAPPCSGRRLRRRSPPCSSFWREGFALSRSDCRSRPP